MADMLVCKIVATDHRYSGIVFVLAGYDEGAGFFSYKPGR
jgi:hypothetical protein